MTQIFGSYIVRWVCTELRQVPFCLIQHQNLMLVVPDLQQSLKSHQGSASTFLARCEPH